MEKMTKRDYFTKLLTISAVAEDEAMVGFIQHELDLLAKKNASRSGELTETQKENIELGKQIVDYVAGVGTPVTVAMIRKHFGVTSQKVTPIMKSLVKAGDVVVTAEKRTSYYTVA